MNKNSKHNKKDLSVEPPKFQVSKKLFRPKFLHIAHHIHDVLLRAPLLIGGFYNWHRVLSGDFRLHSQVRGSLSEYDIIFMGVSRPEMEGLLISEIREEIGWNSKTKIVVCVDYAIEIWNSTFNMKALERELKVADIVFTGEPMMRNNLEALINKPVYFLEHPTNVRLLKQMALPLENRHNAVLCLIHRYNNDWIPPYLAVKDLKEIDNYAVCLDGHPNNLVTKMPFFQNTRAGAEYEQWVEFMRQAKVVLDSYHNMHTYGRNAVDCAALKVPQVGTTIVHAQTILFPELTTEPNDSLGQRDLIKRLVGDPKFYKEVTDYAFEKVEMFGYDNSLLRFQQMMESYESAQTEQSTDKAL